MGVVFISGYRATTATTGTARLAGGEAVTGPSFGQTQAALISGTVFDDQNGDGKRDGTDAGQAGVRVYLDANGDGQYESTEPSVLTDSAGNWSFGVLAPGTYTVRVVTDHLTVTTPAAASFTFGVGHGSTRTGNAFGVDFTFG